MKDQFGNEINSDSAVDSNVEGDTVNQNRGTVSQNMDKAYRNREESLSGRDTVSQDSEEGLTERERRNQDKALIGIFITENEAINVIRELKEIGYREDDITVVAKDKDKMDRIDDITDVNTKIEGNGGRVGSGAAIGGALGGIAAAIPALGFLVIPGIGPILAAGPIAVILGGALAGGVAGGLVGALSEIGVKEDDAREYEHYIKEGKLIIIVENRVDLRDEVHRIFRQNNSV